MPAFRSDAWNFVYENFAAQWFDGFPLGNGDMGALMLSDHKRTVFPLAKSDVWDERCDNGQGRRESFFAFENFAQLRSLIEAREWDRIDQRMNDATSQWTGKFSLLPAGSLVLDTTRFEKEIEILSWHRRLDMRGAVARQEFTTRIRAQSIEAIVGVEDAVLAIQIAGTLNWRKGSPPRSMRWGMDISLPIESADPNATIEKHISDKILLQRVRGYHEVDYAIAFMVDSKGMSVDVDQEAHRLTVTSERKADFTIYATLVSRKDAADPCAEALRRLRNAKKAGYSKIKAHHSAWWKRFWNASSMEIPDSRLLRQYHFGLYLLASSSRRGYRMPGLQGLWSTRPAGASWNDYTNDLNIETCYWPIYTANHLELGWPYYDTIGGWIEQAQRDTSRYYNCRGVQMPLCASGTGICPPGYLTSMHVANTAAFIAQNFWRHWQFSRDIGFLRDVAYPPLKQCALFYADFLTRAPDGVYNVWPSQSPELGEGSYEGWCKNTSMDIALIDELLRAAIDASIRLNLDEDMRSQWHDRVEHLAPLPMRDGALIDSQSKEYLYSHRHNGMLTPIYPCDQLSGPVAARSIDRFEQRGRWLWACFTVTWQCAAEARVGRGEKAHALLQEFVETWTLPQGGFSLTFEYHRTGRGIAGPALWCNEANSGYSAALLEMLLQSQGDILRVFPAVPAIWKSISFQNLRARGAFLVSASKEAQRVKAIRIHSERGGMVRLHNPWSKIPKLSCNNKTLKPIRTNDILEWMTDPKSTYELRPA